MGQFLTKLEQPKLWDGYPFLLSALIGDVDDGLILVVEEYNKAGVYVTETESDTPTSYENSLVNWDVSEIGGTFGEDVLYLIVYLKTDAGEILTDELRIDVIQPCQNPVYLMARNSLGGVLHWMFDQNQEYGLDYDNQIKAKRLTLTSDHLTINEWESLQDFITLGTVYRNSIVEFTSSTIKTSTRVGQQIYVVGTDGSKIGVVALNTRNNTLTRRVRHIFELEIEYPEIFSV